MVSDAVPELTDPSLILERMDEAFYAVGRDWRLKLVNGRAEVFWGRNRRDRPVLAGTRRGVIGRFRPRLEFPRDPARLAPLSDHPQPDRSRP